MVEILKFIYVLIFFILLIHRVTIGGGKHFFHPSQISTLPYMESFIAFQFPIVFLYVCFTSQ